MLELVGGKSGIMIEENVRVDGWKNWNNDRGKR